MMPEFSQLEPAGFRTELEKLDLKVDGKADSASLGTAAGEDVPSGVENDLVALDDQGGFKTVDSDAYEPSQLIAEARPTSNTATVTFDNIPQDWLDLQLVATAPEISNFGDIRLVLNDDDDTNYIQVLQEIRPSNGLVLYAANEQRADFRLGSMGDAGLTLDATIFGYSLSQQHSVISHNIQHRESGIARIFQAWGRNTVGTPITRIDVTSLANGGFRNGSVISLYGRGRA